MIATFPGQPKQMQPITTRPRRSRFAIGVRRSWGALAFVLSPTATVATYSIIASDPQTGQCGIAVQTDNLAVGASVPYAQAGVGAIASQFETNPRHGPRGLALLAVGKSATEVLQQLLREDGNFEGRGPEARQVAIVAADGKTAVHTGTDVVRADWAGSRTGAGFSIQGNGLAGPQVLAAMEQAFLTTTGSLADRLLAALRAGDHAGGQRTGRESAALLVRTREGFPLDVDLRVDHADDPVGELRFLHGLQSARQQIMQARILGRRGNIDEARALLAGARPRTADWPRGAVLAAEVAIELEQPDVALDCLERAFAQNPERIPIVLGHGTFAPLGADARFRRWVTSDIEQASLAAGSGVAGASVLLETGRTSEALALLKAAASSGKTADYFLLLATAHEARGDRVAAIAACEAGLKDDPENTRLILRRSRVQSAAHVSR